MRYIALTWPWQDRAAARRAADIGLQLHADGFWVPAGAIDGLRIWTAGGANAGSRTLVCPLARRAGVVIGNVHRMPGVSFPSPFDDGGEVPSSVEQTARRLSQAHWGRYVALLRDEISGETAIFRDPSGDLGALTWSLGDGLDVTASDLLSLPPGMRPPRLSMNWDRVAVFLAAPSASPEALFDGITSVAPGVLQAIGRGDRRSRALWQPSDFCADLGLTPNEAACELVRRVDEVTADLAADHEGLLVALSGGLDSSILAGALHRTGHSGRVRQWVTRVTDRPEGDERAYARAVTDRIGAALTCSSGAPDPLTLADFAELAGSAWPALNGGDVAHDRDMARRLAATGATAVMSGQGGDAVFFQMPSAFVMADEFGRLGLRALLSPVLPNLARRTQTSVWQILKAARRARRGAAVPPPISALFGRDARALVAQTVHPWVEMAQNVAPGKRLQVHALANCQLYNGDCHTRRAGELLSPLLAQPVVELCLAIPSPVLAGGDHDRAFAREAFADHLPDLVRLRRAKGAMTNHYARWVARSLDVLRPHLLDGRLCASGLIDRMELERALDPPQLIRSPQIAAIFSAAMMESWVVYWQGQVPDSPLAPRPG